MTFDITQSHPAYTAMSKTWELMRDAMAGEARVKSKGEMYLPMKSGTAAIKNGGLRNKAFAAYQQRAEFPELLAPTVGGAVGTVLKQPATITVPKSMELLIKRATLDGQTLAGLHRLIVQELMETGRIGLLPGITATGEPYLASYVAESITNWDSTNQVVDFVTLNETGLVRDAATNKWNEVGRYRECFLEKGAFASREWLKNTKDEWMSGKAILASTNKKKPLSFVPFVFIGTNGLLAAPGEVPLSGLARIAVRIYRLDADYTFALHMTAEPTPVATGFDDPASALKNGSAPTTIGSSKLWLLPKGSDAKFLEFSGPGIAAQEKAIGNALNRAGAYGAQLLTDTSRSAESGEAKKLRLGDQTSTLKTIAMSAAQGLEKALKNIAVWTGADPDEVTVEPNLEFFDTVLSAQEITAIVDAWTSGAYSYPTMFERLQKGQVIPNGRTSDEELDLIDNDVARPPPDPDELGVLSPQ